MAEQKLKFSLLKDNEVKEPIKQIKLESVRIKNEEIHKAMQVALKNGLRVFKSYYKEGVNCTYFNYSDGQNIGYIQAEYSGVHISSIHKPSKIGTGFRITEDHIINVQLEDLRKGFLFAPKWASHSDRTKIKKYESLEEWLNKLMHPEKMVEITL